MLTIKDMSTKELKRALRDTLDLGYWQEDLRSNLYYVGSRVSGESKEGHQMYDCVRATEDEIRKELESRPHISSKREGQLLRRLKAQTGMTEEQLRSHPRYGKELVDIQQSHPRREISKAEAKWYQTIYGKKLFAQFFYVV